MIDCGVIARGSSHVAHVPEVGILAALAREVGPDAARAPEERMVVDELARLRVLAVALGLVAERPDHLRVAVEAALADVDVAARELERRVRLDRRDRRHVRANEERRKISNSDATTTATIVITVNDQPAAAPTRGAIACATNRAQRARRHRRAVRRLGDVSARGRGAWIDRHVVRRRPADATSCRML